MRQLLRILCGSINHNGPGKLLFIDETGEFEIIECERCLTVTIKSLVEGHNSLDYEAVLDRWMHE